MTNASTWATTLAISVMAISISSGVLAETRGRVGIAMPTHAGQRWIADGKALTAAFQEKGYTVDIQYAEDDVPTQLSELENMVTTGAKVLVVTPVDSKSLSAVLQEAADRHIKIVAYDRLLRDTPNVDYNVTFDNFQVGVLQAKSLIKGLQERFPKAKPWTVEVFGGSPDDNNAFLFHDGAMSVLKPMIDSGQIVVKSGRTDMEKVGILHWDPSEAQARMDNLLSAYYSDGSRIDGILSPWDGLSRGIISSLQGVGYGSTDLTWPVITGQDAESPSIKAIIAGAQYSTIFKDTRELAKTTADLVDTIMSGKEPAGLDSKTYNNGVKTVPTVLLQPFVVTAGNYKQLVVESGYLRKEDVQ